MPLLVHDTFTGGPDDLADHVVDESNVGAYVLVNSGGTNIVVNGGAATPQTNSDSNTPGVLLYNVFGTRQIFEVQVDNVTGGFIFPLRLDPAINWSLYVLISAGAITLALDTSGGQVILETGTLGMTGVETMTLELVDDGSQITLYKNCVSVLTREFLDIADKQIAGWQFVGDGTAPFAFGSNVLYEYTLIGSTQEREVDLEVDLAAPLVIFADTFRDAPGAALVEHMPETDRYHARWTPTAGSLQITGGSLVPATAPLSGAYFIGETEGRLELDMEYDPLAAVIIALRYGINDDSGVALFFSEGTITAAQFIGGGFGDVYAGGQFTNAAGTYAVRVDIDGNTFTLYVDEREALSFTTDFNAGNAAHAVVFYGAAFGGSAVSSVTFTHRPVWFTEPYHHQEVVDALPEHCGAEYLTDKDEAEGEVLNNWGKLAAIIGERAQAMEAALVYSWKQTSVAYATDAGLDAVGADYGELRRGRTDDQYRLGIYARMLANNSSGDSTSLYAILYALIPDAEGFNITESNCNLYVTISGGTFDGAYVLLVLRAAKAAGVGLYAIEAPVSEEAFMFTSEVYSSATGLTAAGVGTTYTFEDAGADFITDGVATGDALVIHGYGAEAGIYYIVAPLSATSLQLSTTVPLGLAAVSYTITAQITGLGFDEGGLSDTL